jgi:hypothetical protein
VMRSIKSLSRKCRRIFGRHSISTPGLLLSSLKYHKYSRSGHKRELMHWLGETDYGIEVVTLTTIHATSLNRHGSRCPPDSKGREQKGPRSKE